jgi:hypothetical protein
VSWQRDWQKYVGQQTALFVSAGVKYPRCAEEPISEIVAKAIMSKREYQHMEYVVEEPKAAA